MLLHLPNKYRGRSSIRFLQYLVSVHLPLEGTHTTSGVGLHCDGLTTYSPDSMHVANSLADSVQT